MADEPSQSRTCRRVVGPWGCHAEGSAPSWRSSAASEMLAVRGSGGEAAPRGRRVDAEELGRVEPEETGLHLGRSGPGSRMCSWNCGVISNVRIAMICGSGLPYQMASVPHRTRCAPTRLSSLPMACAAWSGWREELAPERGDVDPDVVVRRHGVAVEGCQQGVDADGGGRVVRALDVRGVPGGVVHDELHVGELARDGHDVLGMVEGRVEVHQRQALVRHEDLHAEVVRMLDGREADGGIFQRVALAARAPRRVHLEGGGRAGRARRSTSPRGWRSTGPTLGAMMFSTSSRLAPPSVSPAVICWVRQRLGERDRRVGRSRVRDVGQHGHRGVAGQEDVVQVVGPVDAVELIGVGAAGGEHGEHERGRVRSVVDPGSGRDDMVGVDVEDELRSRPAPARRRRCPLAAAR